jgi:type II secretory pathway component PulM
VAQAAILAPAAIAYQNLLRNAYSQIEELKTQVAKLKGLQPEVRDTGADVAQPGRILSSPNGDFVKDLVNKFQQSTGLQ